MVGYRIDYSRAQQLNANSEVYSGAKLYVYQNNTTTLVDVFSDRDALVSAANPVVADSSGRLPVRYVDADDMLTLVLKTSADVEIWSDDDQEPVPNITNADLANYLPLAGGTMTGPLRFAEGAAVVSSATVNLDASTGNFLHITGTTGITAITLSQGAMRWVVFDGALTLTHSSNLILPGSLDITTVANDCALFVGEGSGVTRLLWYRCVDGKPLIENADLILALSDESTAITTGTAKLTFRMPFTMYLTSSALPRASLTGASSSGNPAIDINQGGVSIFSTTLTIDSGELTSGTAAVPAVLASSPITLSDNASMTIDIDTAGTNATGLKVHLRGYRRNR